MEGGAALADMDTVDDGDVMNKHVDKEGIVQDMVAEDGDGCTQFPLDEGGGTDSTHTDAGGDLTVLHRGGEAIYATIDVVGEVDEIKNNTSSVEFPVKDDEAANLLKSDTNRGGNAIHATVDAVGEADVIKNDTSS